MINEELIEEVMDLYGENEDLFFEHRDELANKQLALAACLTDESMDVLTDDEYDLMWFVVSIVYGVFRKEKGDLPVLDVKTFEQLEDDNWSAWNDNGAPFDDKVNDAYDASAYPALIEFIAESLESDEEFEVSNTGRDVIFVTAKSIVDAFATA